MGNIKNREEKEGTRKGSHVVMIGKRQPRLSVQSYNLTIKWH